MTVWPDSLIPVQKIIFVYYFIIPDTASGGGQASSPLLTLCHVLKNASWTNSCVLDFSALCLQTKQTTVQLHPWLSCTALEWSAQSVLCLKICSRDRAWMDLLVSCQNPSLLLAELNSWPWTSLNCKCTVKQSRTVLSMQPWAWSSPI